MKAVILAAGRSMRLYPITLNKPKCLLKIGQKTILERQIGQLNDLGINKILIVTGYLSWQIEEVSNGKAECIYFPNYAKTNNLHTLWHIKDRLNDDFVCLFSDVVFDKGILKDCVNSEKDFCLAIGENAPETMKVEILNGSIISVGKHITQKEAKENFIGMAKFSKKGAKLLKQEMKNLINGNFNAYYTIALNELAKKGIKIGFVRVNERPWIEIDTKEDLERAVTVQWQE